MRKVLYILIFLPFIFMGSAGKYQTQDTRLPAQILDTSYLKMRAQQMADSAAYSARRIIDSASYTEKRIIGRVDTEYRPVMMSNRTVKILRFDWEWIYKVVNKDTSYDTVLVKQVPIYE